MNKSRLNGSPTEATRLNMPLSNCEQSSINEHFFITFFVVVFSPLASVC